MFTKLVSWLIVIGLINFSIGCAVQRTIKPSENSFDAKYKIVSVILNNGEKIVFDKAGGRYNPSTRTVDGFARHRQLHAQTGDPDAWLMKPVSIKIEDIESANSVSEKEISTTRSIAAFIAAGVLIPIIIIAISFAIDPPHFGM